LRITDNFTLRGQITIKTIVILDKFIIHVAMSRIRAKAFTLIELIISLVIVALLAWVIFETYRTILDITLRVENEKIVANEMLFAHQVIQSLVDNYTIDFARYNYVIPNNGVTNILYLTGRGGSSSYTWSYMITQVGDAITLTRWVWGSSMPLTDTWSVLISWLQFQIIPFNTTWSNVAWAIPIGGLYFANANDIQHPWFWMRGTMYIKRYKQATYIWSVKQSIQSFFNIRSY
jgi:prepilin-type N-terminal cleavage/methylation domain-containing protein